MKAENLLKLTKSEKIKNFVPKFWVIENVTELHIEDFADDKLYAVRSSCDVEDSSTSSYAGCFTTLLNVKKDGLKAASNKVFESFGKHSGKVIIQEMVLSEISGIIFTANPIGILNEIVIVAGLGLGDGVVEDKVSTTTYYYNADDKIYYYDGEKLLKNEENKRKREITKVILNFLKKSVDIPVLL